MVVKELLDIYDDWQSKLEKNEWYFSDAFDHITKNMTSYEAFSYIPNVVNALLELRDETLIWETLDLLGELYTISDTTEVHPVLNAKWSLLENHIRHYKEAYATPFQELKRMLRKKS
ncbi:ABC transporter [Sporolactobacillus shoreicorticis]|uniref:ABC transporter n=1 Tax=Sporolactobacillus shoreicorticis TaxID=1923877 RepID=A0ABW5S4A3_9BACL|nr:ABC transporter [Sporolactobacillus shoreicorticis]MCO7125905.1 ABC transporter [Sporolactobacillus shoreicorticis]